MKAPLIARADLEAEIESLQNQKRLKLTEANQIDGAIQMAQHLIAKLEKRAEEEQPAELPQPQATECEPATEATEIKG